MLQPQKLASLRRTRDQILYDGQRLIGQGRHLEAEEILKPCLEQWRKEGGPKEEEHKIVLVLGKSLEGQKKNVEAYEVYMKALNGLTGEAYDDVYSAFLYLNERMGAFDKKSPY